MLLLSAYYVLLAKYTGKNDIVVGSKISGRTHADLENIIGIFVNMLALRNFPAKDKSFKEFLNEVKESSLRAYDNQDYSFADLVRKLRSSRQDGRNPLFETVFAMGNMDIGEIKIKNLEVIQQTPSNMPTQYDLHIEALEDGNKINMLFSYSVKLFKQTTIEKMACRFQDILHQVLENIDVKIQDITFTHDLLNVSSNIYTGDQEDFEF
jgi:non-ribosomal peptide synthetase component F